MSEKNNPTEITKPNPDDQASSQTSGTSFLRLFQKRTDKIDKPVTTAPSTKANTEATNLARLFSDHKQKAAPSTKANTAAKTKADEHQPLAKADNKPTQSSRQKILHSLSSIFGDKNETEKPKLAPANTNKSPEETKPQITKLVRKLANDSSDQDNQPKKREPAPQKLDPSQAIEDTIINQKQSDPTKANNDSSHNKQAKEEDADTTQEISAKGQKIQATEKKKTKKEKTNPVQHKKSKAITTHPEKVGLFKRVYLTTHNYYLKTKTFILLSIAFTVSLPTLMIILAPIVAGFIIGLQAFSSSSQDVLNISAAFNFITDPRALAAFSNSLIIAAVVGILAPVSVMLMSFIGLYNKPFGLLFNTISSIGLIAPNIAFAVMCLSIIHLLELTPSLFSLIIAHYFYALPIAAIAIDQGRKYLTNDVINTAEDLYATPWMVIGRIAFPILKPSLNKAFFLCASLSISDILIGHLISGEKPLTLGAFVFYLWEVGNNKQVSFGILIMFIMGLGLAMFGIISSKLKENNPPVGETREGKRAGNIKDEVTLDQRNPSGETA